MIRIVLDNFTDEIVPLMEAAAKQLDEMDSAERSVFFDILGSNIETF